MKNFINNMNMRISQLIAGTLIITSLVLVSCEKFLEVNAPSTQIDAEKAFSNDAAATSAVLGIYAGSIGGQSGILKYYSICMGNSADELQAVAGGYPPFLENAIPVTSGHVDTYLWGASYAIIAQCNLAIESLENSTGLSTSVKSTLLGEVKFWRAFVNFYLVNMFGDVPMPLGTDAIENGNLGRQSATDIWGQITDDLTEAQNLLPGTYPPTATRTRVNKSAADALLARVCLYLDNWEGAERAAAEVIDNSTEQYALVDGEYIGEVFKNSSEETILQLSNIEGISTFGALYNYVPGVIPAISIPDKFIESFDQMDKRRTSWVEENSANGKMYYEVDKYKIRSGFGGDEYDVIIRLAELYLIRAEARAQLGQLTGINSAKEDLDLIRDRAGLLPIEFDSKAELLLAIENERKFELFGEMGHRWLDLKRTPSLSDPAKSRADDVLEPLKTSWTPTAVLYPIPQAQRLLNKSLYQNPGYTP